MDKKLRETAETILHSALRAVQPDAAVRRALESAAFPGRVCLVAVGKAAWQMAHAAYETLGERISGGIVVTPTTVATSTGYGSRRMSIPK